MNEDYPTNSTSVSDAIVVDLGSRKKKQVKQLRKGRGKLMEDVQHTIAELTTAGELSGNIQPVIIVVREKPNSKWMFGMMPN